mgnify:CR=1 FL=1
MNYFLKFILILSIVFISACKNNDEKISVIDERDLDLQMIDAYNEGIKLLDERYPLKAAKKFNEAELLYPQSLWAPRSALMSAYSYYFGSYYIDAIDELNEPIYFERDFEEDKNYWIKKLGVSNKDFEDVMNKKPKFYYDYPNNWYLNCFSTSINVLKNTLALHVKIVVDCPAIWYCPFLNR